MFSLKIYCFDIQISFQLFVQMLRFMNERYSYTDALEIVGWLCT